MPTDRPDHEQRSNDVQPMRLSGRATDRSTDASQLPDRALSCPVIGKDIHPLNRTFPDMDRQCHKDVPYLVRSPVSYYYRPFQNAESPPSFVARPPVRCTEPPDMMWNNCRLPVKRVVNLIK